MKPFAESCAQNQAEICRHLQTLLSESEHVLEIGSGTGQHAVYFAKQMPHLIWQTSDLLENHSGIKLWLDEAELDNTRYPIELNVSNNKWPKVTVDAIFSANAVHIMSWHSVIDFVVNASNIINTGGLFILYGPFNYNGSFTSQSNANFDQWLKAIDPNSGGRDFEALDNLAQENQLQLIQDIEMASNNRILCWQKN